MRAIEPGASACHFGAQILCLCAVRSGLRGTVSKVVFHHQRRRLVFRLRCGEIRAPLPIVHCAQYVSRGDALTFVRKNRRNVSINWGGDEDVTIEEWCTYVGELIGKPAKVVVKEAPGTLRGLVADVTKRRSITGPCTVSWREGIAQTLAARHPGLG